MPLFFTLPPRSVPYPYVLVNANRPGPGLAYLSRYGGLVEAVVLDSGVEVFRGGRAREYPGGPEAWIARVVHLYDRVRGLARGAEVLATCPDYPDDYAPRSLWLSDDETNIERTVYNVLRCVDWYPDVEWLVPVQGWFGRPSSLLISLEYLEQLGVLDSRRRLAIANLCVESSVRVVRDSVLYVYSWLRGRGYGCALHVFGLRVSALGAVESYISSFDSFGWTRPVSKRLSDAMNWSCKCEEECTLFFCEYLLRLTGHSVPIPLDTLGRCLELLPTIERALARRYPTRWGRISRALSEVRESLERVVNR